MGNLEQETAAVVPLLATALNGWQELGLEIGETALVSGEGPLARMFCLAALWHGACPVILLAAADPGIPGVGTWTVPSDDPEPTLEKLAGRLAGDPAVAAVDLSGRAFVADSLFEVLPVYTRLMLAGSAGEPLTIDYYNNIHRKGLTVLARRIDSDSYPDAGDDPMMARARALLACPERAEAVVAAAEGS